MEEEPITQVRYNFLRSEKNPSMLEWFFLMINQEREFDRISARIYELFSPVIEEYRGDAEGDSGIEGIIKGTGLRYKLINFESKKRVEPGELSLIFKKMRKDTNLYRRKKDSLGLFKYIESMTEKLS